jgi:hypothetical protein
MNKNVRRVPALFDPETRFAVQPVTPAPFRVLQDTEFERLKSRLLAEQLANAREAELYAPLRRAANEAAALAWVTFYPLLVFPVLFEEKTRTAISQHERQTRILAKNRGLIAA